MRENLIGWTAGDAVAAEKAELRPEVPFGARLIRARLVARTYSYIRMAMGTGHCSYVYSSVVSPEWQDSVICSAATLTPESFVGLRLHSGRRWRQQT
jgi:hypothetical protein